MKARDQETVTILDALRDPELFGSQMGDSESWEAWHSFLAALFGLPMTKEQQVTYQRCTRRRIPPTKPSKEAWLVVGRRGGKSRTAALVAVFAACFRDYRATLAPGEHGTVMVIAADRRQARVVFRYVARLLESSPILIQMVEHKTKEAIHLTNRVIIEVHTASFRTVRGYTVVAAICDEIAYWRSAP